MKRDLQEIDAQLQRLMQFVECCLDSELAYKIFAMLGAISQLGIEDKQHYLELVRESGVYT